MQLLDSLRKLFQGPPGIRMPRRWPRILMMEATTVTLAGGRRATLKLANLSAGGARVQSMFRLRVHDQLTLEVPLGAGARCVKSAEVVYCKRDPQGLHYVGGLSFLGPSRDGIAEVAAFISDEQRRRSGARDIWQR